MTTKPLDRPWWEQIVRGQKRGLFADSVRHVARLGSLGYRLGMQGRELAYKRGWLSVKRLPQPTICVGNITVGGTGKTPLVIRLATDLMAAGLRPAVLLRGYKREEKRRSPVLVRDPKHIVASVAEAGDEAMELAVRLPGACIGVGADRYAVGRFLLNRYPIDCFILDDGFQHHRLERDINIVTLDVTDPWGGGALLPAGLLREPPEALKRADAVVLTRTRSVSPDRLAIVRTQVAGFLRKESSLMESRHEPRSLLSLTAKKTLGLPELRNRSVLAISGIGNPQAFESTLAEEGARITGRLRLGDHEGDASSVWEWIRAHQRPGTWVVMTEKDAMRWADKLAEGQMSGLYALRMELVLSAGRPKWTHLINLIRKLNDAH
jgi:tetraacyldisaccharide 4'-kinase